MKKQAKLAFEQLEKEMEMIPEAKQETIIGGMGSGGFGSSGSSGSSGYNPGDPMVVSQNTINFMKTAEGFRGSVYKDSRGNYTVGWGHKLTVSEIQDYQNNTFDTSHDHLVELFQQDLQYAENIVNNAITNQNLSKNQFGAMVDLVFNTGGANFENTNMVTDINNGNFSAASEEFENWNRQHSNGIDTRRANEENLFDALPISTGGDPYNYQYGIHTDRWNNNH